jgi:hypothetical protein
MCGATFMPQSLMAFVGIWSVFVLLLTGCDRTDPVAPGSAQEDIFQAHSEPVQPNVVLPISVTDGLDGNIIIIAARDPEVAADAVDTGVGGSVEPARREAQDHNTLKNTATQVQIQPRSAADGSAINPADRAFLHVRVPLGAVLTEVRTRTGDIGIYGAVSDVTAAVETKGNIEVLGGNGNVNLTTANGGIQIDLMPGKRIDAHASQGNLDIIAVDALVSASTTEQNVRFIGTLRSSATHVFSTTGGGNVTVAVPAYPKDHPRPAIYRVTARTSVHPIIIDFPPDQKDSENPLAICGVIHSAGPYDYHVESTTVRFGRIEVTPAMTTTSFYFSGVLTTSYYRFDTDRPQLSLFTPRSQSIHIYTAADLAKIAAGKVKPDTDCEAALRDDLNQPTAISLDLKSGSGRIFFHHIDMQ